jgi:hypothetical protein
MAVFNVILISFIFFQLRDSRKPLIITKIIPRDKEVTDRPDVLEAGTLYLVITNDSNNIARAIDIEYQFNFNGHSIPKKEKMLSHLNPKEATKIILKRGWILDKYPDRFEEIIIIRFVDFYENISLKIIMQLNGALAKVIRILMTILFLIVGTKEIVNFIFIKLAGLGYDI